MYKIIKYSKGKTTLVILIARAHCPAVGSYIIEVHHMG
jgi:hypothetical protein